MGLMTLVLVRHGETDWTAQRRYCGKTDVPLNASGRVQAVRLAPVARDDFETIWTSPLARCVETAELMGVDAVASPLIQEFDFGELEGMRWDKLTAESQAALVDFEGFVAPGGEAVVDFATRIERFVAGLADGRHLIVTHGGVIRHLLRAARRDEHVAAGTSVVVEVPVSRR